MIWHTKGGQPIALTFHEQDSTDQRGLNKGWVVRRVDAFLDGEHAGYLKISYVPKERVVECFPTLWHWFAGHQGWCFDPDDLTDTWLRAHHYASHMPRSVQGQGIGYTGALKGHEPDEEAMRADLECLADTYVYELRATPQKTFDTWVEHMADYAFVDYIKVFEPYLRQGVGTALYIEGARWLAECFNLPLHASGLQQPEAEAAWAAMYASGRWPIYPVDREDGKRVLRIDFTRE